MRTVLIPKPANDSLIAQLGSLYNTLKDVKFGEKLDFDLCLLKWACPLLVLPISAYINETGSQFKMDKCEVGDYLGRMGFPKGVDSISAFQKHKTFEQAITEAMKGNSVKKEKERGYGLRTSKEVVCKALNGGGFILISGSSALVSTKQGDNLVSLPDFYWQGVIISYRIPKPTGAIDYLKYTE